MEKFSGLYKCHELTVDWMADLMPCYGRWGTIRIAIVCTRFRMCLAHKVEKL